jgi:hypothetical protein
VFDLLADLDDMAAELMTEDDGVVDRPGMIGGPLVEVRSADPDIGDFEDFSTSRISTECLSGA